MARQLRYETPDNLDRWMVSYADFITLLFAFFVVMYAISSVNEGKYKIFSTSLITAFGNRGTPRQEAVSPTSEQDMLLKSLVARRDAKQVEQQNKQRAYMQSVAKNLNHAMEPLITSGQVSVSQTSRGVVLDIKASALFNEGDAELQGNSIKTLAEVARILGEGDQAVEVEGHTDDTPIKNKRFPSNWELSSARASSVVRLFIERGVAETRLTVVGSAANQPVAPNNTPDGRARNRRVIVTILSPTAGRLTQQAVP